MYKIYSSSAAALNGEYIYFSARDYNALLRTSIYTNKTEYICSFANEEKMERLHIKAFSYETYVWFIPLFGKYITRFDTVKNEMINFDVDEDVFEDTIEEYCYRDSENHFHVPIYFDAGWIDDERIFLVPAGVQNLCIVNLKDSAIKKINIDINPRKEFLGIGTCCRNEIWMAPYMGEDLVIVDYITGHIRRLKKPDGLGNYYGIASNVNRVYLSDSIKNIYYYEWNEKAYSKIKLDIVSKEEQAVSVRDIIIYKDRLIMLPIDSEMIVEYDLKCNTACRLEWNYDDRLGIMTPICFNESGLMCVSYTEAFFCIIDNFKQLRIISEVDSTSLKNVLEKNSGDNVLTYMIHDGIIQEEKIGLENFIAYIV